MVGRVLVDFSVVKDVITVRLPSTSQPLVSMLIDYTFLRVVVVDVLNSVLLHLVVAPYIVHVFILVVARSAKGSHGLTNEGEPS